MPEKKFMGSVSTRCVVLLTVFALAITGVVNSSNGAEAQAPDNILRLGFLDKVDSLNPNVGFNDASYVLYGLLYDCLQSVGNDLETVPNLATGWRVAEDYLPYGSAWEFDITNSALWHDGEPFTVDDVVFTVNLNADNYTMMWAYQPYTYYMDYAEKVDADTVRIHFYDRSTAEPMPVNYAPSLYIPILPRHMMESMSTAEIGFNWPGVFEYSDPPIVGTGAFMATEDIYSEFLQGDRLTLVKNPNYHWKFDKPGAPEISFDGIEMFFFDDATAMSLALEIGDIDVAQLPRQEYIVLKDKVWSGEVQDIVTFDGLQPDQEFVHLLINQNDAGPNPSRLDPVISQVMAMATDKEYITDNFYYGLADEGSTLVSPISDWHYEPADEAYDYDITEANALLEDAGYRFTESSPDVRICTADSYAVQQGLVAEGTPLQYEMTVRQEYPEEKDIAVYLQSEWAEVGIEIDYTIMSEPALGALVYSYSYDTAIWEWWSDPDPNYILFCQSKRSWNGWSDNMYTSLEYEENYTRSVQEFDIEKREEYVDNCQKVHYLDVPYIIFAYPYQTYAWRTDHFTGWGDWAEDPGRSIDACWGANPLYFDLTAEPDVDDPPTTDVSLLGTMGDNGWYVSDVVVTLSAEDDSGDDTPPFTTASVNGTVGDNGWHTSEVTVYLYAHDDSGMIEGTYYAVDSLDCSEYAGGFTISEEGTHIVVYYSVDLAGNREDNRTMTVKLDWTPPEVEIGTENGTVFDSPHVSIDFTSWDELSGADYSEYSLDGGEYGPCDDDYVHLYDLDNGIHELTVRAFDMAGNSASDWISFEVNYSVEPEGIRSVDYLWYDMFNHSFGPWYEYREYFYGNERTVTDSYPYLYVVENTPPGNTLTYTFMRLDVTGRNMTDLSMLGDSEFLPFFGAERGGNAEIDWHMDYLTYDEAEAKLSPAAMSWYDGWYIALNGSVVLDRQATKSVLGITDAQFDDFDSWWSVNGDDVRIQWMDWMESEGERLMIYNMYEYPLTFVFFTMDAQRVGDDVIVGMDSISWGMEALMANWLHEAFVPTEWYMEDFGLHASIGPQSTDIDVDAAVAYSVFAYESPLDGTPCWAWEAMLGDYVESSTEYPVSDFDLYADASYLNLAPGSDWYGEMMPYDYTPGAWNLSMNETLAFEWPDGEQLFLVHDSEDVGGGTVEGTLDLYANMTVEYAEPMPSDAPTLITVDHENRRITYEGPFDMWTWSKEQTTHGFLADEWDRLGILPYGMPYVVFTPEEAPLAASEAVGGAMATASSREADYSTGINWTGYRLDGGEWQTYTSHFLISEDGVHTLEYYSDDVVGNIEDVNSIEIKIDKTAPTIAMDQEDGAEFPDDAVNVSWSCSDACSGVATIEYRVDDGPYSACENLTWAVLSDLEPGSHNVTVRVQDEAGNEASYTVRIEVTESGDDIGILVLWGGIAGALVLAAVATVLLLMARKKRHAPPDNAGPPPG